MNINDDKYDSEATIEDETACDAAATDGKFVGNWTFTVSGTTSTYSVNVTDATGDYTITANTDFGLPGVSATNINMNVAADIASASTFNIGNAQISDMKLTYITASSATLSATVSGTGVADGTFIDQGTK